MSLLDRAIAGFLVAVALAIVLPAVLPALTTAAVVGTACFVAVRLVLYLTDRY